jgi:adenosylhomocysteine nucleosidase
MPSCKSRLHAILYLLLGAGSTALAASPQVPLVERDTVPRIAVVSAFDAELAKLRDSAQLTGRIVSNGRTLWLGKLRGHDVVLLLSGYSIVNATSTSEALLDKLRIRAIVFSGIAGGVNPDLRVGDVTVAAQWGNYQEQLFARKTDTGWDAGPRKGDFPNFGMMFPRPQSVARVDRPADSLETRFWFPVDTSFLSVARSLDVPLKRCASDKDCLDRQPRIVVGGNGVSGPTFVDNAEYRTFVWNTFHADALDMETSAVAFVAYLHRVPFVAFRSLSDLAGGGPGRNEARTFGRLAADNSASVVLSFLGKLPSDKGGKGR